MIPRYLAPVEVDVIPCGPVEVADLKCGNNYVYSVIKLRQLGSIAERLKPDLRGSTLCTILPEGPG